MPAGAFYNWFNTTVYFFHVPLFFICSGFLFQKYSEIRTVIQWKTNVIKKFIALGVPYFIFSIITWILKKAFSSSVNTQLNGLGETLFQAPASPYWYLYTLFFILVITITTKSKADALILLAISFTCKILSILGFHTNIYAISSVMANWIWFVIGIMIANNVISLLNINISLILLTLFITASVIIQLKGLQLIGVDFVMGVLACYSIVSLIHGIYSTKNQSKVMDYMSKYTMPVFLMHTLFAAPLRSLLLKIGINNVIIHFTLGLIISFIGPIIAMRIMERLKPLDFIVYPNRYIKIAKK